LRRRARDEGCAARGAAHLDEVQCRMLGQEKSFLVRCLQARLWNSCLSSSTS
jgi:hypothetical protein